MRKGETIVCTETAFDESGEKLFEKGDERDILYVDNESPIVMVILPEGKFPLEWIKKRFRRKI
jgi:hypothetical protein